MLILALLILMFAACDDGSTSDSSGPNNDNVTGTPITYTITQIGGTADTADSSGIVFTFNSSIDSLSVTAADITLSGSAEKGSAVFTGSGVNWTLSPITVNSAGSVTVKITKTGITDTTQSSSVFKMVPGTVKDLTNVTFPRITNTWTQANVTQEIGAAITRLSDQSKESQLRFEDWASELRIKNINNDPEITSQIEYAEYVILTQKQLQNAGYGNNNDMTRLKSIASGQISGLNSASRGLIKNSNDRALYSALQNAFNTVIRLNSREHLTSNGKTTMEAILAREYDLIEQRGGQRPPQGGDYGAAVQWIRNELKTLLPEEAGPYRNDIVQQLENYTQFADAWTADISTLGYNTNPPQVSRAALQTQSGLVK